MKSNYLTVAKMETAFSDYNMGSSIDKADLIVLPAWEAEAQSSRAL